MGENYGGYNKETGEPESSGCGCGNIENHYYYASNRPYICPVCGGVGKVDSTFYGYASTTAITKMVCKSCEGKGIVWSR